MLLDVVPIHLVFYIHCILDSARDALEFSVACGARYTQFIEQNVGVWQELFVRFGRHTLYANRHSERAITLYCERPALIRWQLHRVENDLSWLAQQGNLVLLEYLYRWIHQPKHWVYHSTRLMQRLCATHATAYGHLSVLRDSELFFNHGDFHVIYDVARRNYQHHVCDWLLYWLYENNRDFRLVHDYVRQMDRMHECVCSSSRSSSRSASQSSSQSEDEQLMERLESAFRRRFGMGLNQDLPCCDTPSLYDIYAFYLFVCGNPRKKRKRKRPKIK